MLCGALSFSRFRASEGKLVMDPMRAIHISGGKQGFRTPNHVVKAMDEDTPITGSSLISTRARNIEEEGNI